MTNIVPLRQVTTDPTAGFDQFMAVYPKTYGIGGARRQWIWAIGKCNNDPTPIIEGAMRYAAYVAKQQLDYAKVLSPGNWLADEHWHNVYELPKLEPKSPAELETERLTRLAKLWWGQPETSFKREFRKNQISDADKQALRSRGLIDRE